MFYMVKAHTMKLAFFLGSATLALVTANPAPGNKDVLDCLTNPCLNVPGVGKLKGTKKSSSETGRDIFSYYAIPYGQPTSGERRFAPPEPAPPVNDGSEVFDATYLSFVTSAYGKLCPQPGISLGGSYVHGLSDIPIEDTDDLTLNKTLKEGESRAMAGSEDCLHLAVFTPRKPDDIESAHLPLLPVMFFIHGGGFSVGTYFGMGPKELLEKEVVLVEIQYRLGPLGFMCLDHEEIAGNMGMLDQALALEWVKNHIAGFGGNPNEITIFGESAGAASVSYHLLSPLSRNNFQKVIGQSGSALAGWAFDTEPDKHAKELASRLNCPTDDMNAMVKCLKYEKTTEEIIDVHRKYIKFEQYNGRMGFGGTTPCAQTKGSKVFIDKHPEDYLRGGDFEPKTAFFGANKHEGSFVLGVMYDSFIVPHGYQHNQDFLRHQFIPVMLDALGLNDKSGVIYEILEHDYFSLRDVGEWDRMMPGMINLVGTFFIKAPTYEFLKYNSLRGGSSYFYSFEFAGANTVFSLLFPGGAPPLPHGVTHGDDLIYIFSTGLFSNFPEDDKRIRKQMVELWTNFAIYGELTPANHAINGIPNIPQWNEDVPSYLKIDKYSDVIIDYVETWSNPDLL